MKNLCLNVQFQSFFSDPDIALELVLNLNQIPLSYVLPGKYTFDLKGSKTDPFKDVQDIRYHLYLWSLYSGKTKRNIPKYDWPSCFDVTFTPNH